MTVTFTHLIDRFSPEGENQYAVTIPESWMQGRSTYGGLSSAIALEGAIRSFPHLPPLRSAQITFVGPVGGGVVVKASLLREGKSVAYVNVDVMGEKGIGVHATFAFGAARASALNTQFIASPDLPGPEDLASFFPDGLGPAFAQHFDARLAKGEMPFSNHESGHDLIFWTKFKEDLSPTATSLLALADMPPPAITPMFPHFAPLSSMTWMINILTEELTTKDGWWLQRSVAEHAQNGYSSQDMMMWNHGLEPVMVSRQNVAIFV
ncbi:MAG: thioesterase family protein [Pseudomonadota bacterium]